MCGTEASRRICSVPKGQGTFQTILLFLQLPRAHGAAGDEDSSRPAPNPQTPSSTRTRQVLHSPQPATSGGVPQPQLAVICPIPFDVSSLIAPVFTAPREEPLPKQTWGWWKEVSRSSGAPQQLDGSCPRSLLFSTPLWFLREAVQQCLLYLRHRHTPSIPKITVSLPQPQLSLQSRSRDTDTQGITGHVG